MKKTILLASVLIIISSGFVLFKINNHIKEKNYNEVYDTISKILATTIAEQGNQALGLAIALSKNTTIQTALLHEDEDLGYEVLSQNLNSLKQYLNWENIYTQILTKDLFIFARSWDSTFSGMPLENYRDDLKEILKSQKPKVEISIGRLISMKASVPISYQDETLGTLEVISLLDNVVNELRKYNIEMIPLMDISFINQAYFMDQNPIVNNSLIVANKNFNKKSLENLQSLSRDQIRSLLENDFLSTNDNFFAKYPMKNGKNETLGYFISVITTKDLFKYIANDDSILKKIITLNSTKQDIYNYVKYKDENIFLNIDSGYMANFDAIINKNEHEEFEQIARAKLQRLTKRELIDFILNKSKQKNITGEIK